MTYAAIPALRVDDALAKEWTPLLASHDLRPRAAAGRRRSSARCAGMGMTEKQGGSDVRANVTEARPTQTDGRLHAARPQVVHLGADERRLPGAGPGRGRRDLLRGAAGAARRHPQPARRRPAQGQARQPLQRLLASSSSTAPSRSGSATRAAASARSSRWSPRPGSTACSARPALMRRAVSEASWHVAHRSAFGSLLADKPLMQNVVADLAVESEAATVLALRLAVRRRRPRRPRTRRRCGGSRCRWPSSGSASARPPSPPRRWSASAATGTSRSR